MSIAFGWITSNGELVAASDSRATDNNTKTYTDNTDKTFSLYNNSIIGAFTGNISFDNKNVRQHLEDISNSISPSKGKKETIQELVLEFAKRFEKHRIPAYDNNYIIFLSKSDGVPFYILYFIKNNPPIQPLIIDCAEVKQRFIPFGNQKGFEAINQVMINPAGDPKQVASFAIQNAIDEVSKAHSLTTESPNPDCGGPSNVRYIP